MTTVAVEGREWLWSLARVGFAAKALIYITVGSLAFKAAAGMGGRLGDSDDALVTLLRQPFGQALLWAMAFGLFGYAAWRLTEAFLDPLEHGLDAKGIAARAASAVRGIVHGSIGVQAFKLAAGLRRGGTGNAAAEALSLPFGGLLVAVAGLIVLAYGGLQIRKAWRCEFGPGMDVAQLRRDVGEWVVTLSRFGMFCRGIVLGTLGGLAILAAVQHDPSRVSSTSQAFRVFVAQPFGGWLLAAIACGFIAYGLYQFAQARYARFS